MGPRVGPNRAVPRGLPWLMAVLAAAATCDDRLSSSTAPTADAVRSRDPVARPASVVGTFVAPSLDRTHDLLRSHYGAAPLLVGHSWAGSVTALVGLPITTAEHIDLRAPVRIAITSSADGGFAVAIPLLHPDRLLLAATGGEAAPFRAERVEPAGLDRLTPQGKGPSFSLGVATNHLIVAPSDDILLELGAFLGDPASATFVLPPDQETPAVAGTIDALALAGWAGVPTESPLPAPLSLPDGLAVAIVGAGTLDVVVTIDERAIFALVASGSPFLDTVGLGAGPVDALLALPAQTEVGQLTFASAGLREREARATRPSLEALLGGGAAEARSGIEAALVALAEARADDLAIGYERGPRGPTIYGAMGLGSKAKAAASLDAIVDALASKEVERSLEQRGVELSAKRTVIERVGEAYRVRVRPRSAPGSESGNDAAAFAIQLDDDRGYLGAGADPALALATARGRVEGGSRLADLGSVRDAARRLGPRVSLVYFFDPSRLLGDRPVGDVARNRSVVLVALEPADRGAALRVVLDRDAFAAIASRFR